jgi:hypothetical protein
MADAADHPSADTDGRSAARIKGESRVRSRNAAPSELRHRTHRFSVRNLLATYEGVTI